MYCYTLYLIEINKKEQFHVAYIYFKHVGQSYILLLGQYDGTMIYISTAGDEQMDQ